MAVFVESISGGSKWINCMPEEWLKRINNIAKEAVHDKGILHLEGRMYAQIH